MLSRDIKVIEQKFCVLFVKMSLRCSSSLSAPDKNCILVINIHSTESTFFSAFSDIFIILLYKEEVI